MKQHTLLAFAAVAALLAGCVTVKAPDKPIEINLNVNIRQEVVYSLKQDANDLIKDNPELFPK
ncbi:MAG: YnbE family lipoprotein [Sphingomonadaceae bacterium]|uniref:YnbE family lipoprotein n=1 Tax=Aquisediminimonas profunda TaxID=1550733 RepID=UPI001C62C3F1|nr:YnbE family lipoprotein [Aquisediminimonas profunda]